MSSITMANLGVRKAAVLHLENDGGTGAIAVSIEGNGRRVACDPPGLDHGQVPVYGVQCSDKEEACSLGYHSEGVGLQLGSMEPGGPQLTRVAFGALLLLLAQVFRRGVLQGAYERAALALGVIGLVTVVSIALRAVDKYDFSWLTAPPAIMYGFMPGVADPVVHHLRRRAVGLAVEDARPDQEPRSLRDQQGLHSSAAPGAGRPPSSPGPTHDWQLTYASAGACSTPGARSS